MANQLSGAVFWCVWNSWKNWVCHSWTLRKEVKQQDSPHIGSFCSVLLYVQTQCRKSGVTKSEEAGGWMQSASLKHLSRT